MRRTPLALGLLLTVGAAVVFGVALHAGERPGLRVRGGPPPVRVIRSDCAGKPLPALGDVVLSVMDRPAPDRAVVRMDWTRGSLGEACRLQVVAPEGCWIADGYADVLLPAELTAGASTVTIAFPPDRTLDLVVRLCALVDGAAVTREWALRLWEVPPEPDDSAR